MEQFEPIAIIGQGCVLPGCLSVAELWQAILAGEVKINAPSGTDWRLTLDKFVTPQQKHDHIATAQGGYVTDFARVFNATDYSLAPEIIKELDAVFQWSLYAAREALLDANALTTATKGNTGVVLGNLSYPTKLFSELFEQYYLKDLLPEFKFNNNQVKPLNRFMSGLPAILVKKGLGLTGDAYALDAACASGLYAIKLACDMLADGSHELMVAGGVNAADPLCLHLGFTALHAISPSGRSRPFNREADGLIPAEGAAFVVLKRLSSAVRDQDKIYGVIRGIGLANDGRTGSFLSPAVAGQVTCMEQAFKQAQIDPKEVSWIECHATGTKAGDGVEISSMSRIFGTEAKIAIGSLKANFGHLITTSGVAGLIKVCSAMQEGVKPMTPNAFPLLAALEQTQFQVLNSPVKWEGAGKKKIACVSSFGFGGNNAHLIVEEWHGESSHSLSRVERKPQEKIAVVGIGVHTNKSNNIAEFLELLQSNKYKAKEDLTEVAFLSSELFFPPTDLQVTLGQQLVLLKVIKEALSFNCKLKPAETSVIIGMEADLAVNRYLLRLRLQDWLQENKLTLADIGLDRECPPLRAAGATGAMANIIANRINNQYNFSGPSFVVSQEELSGDKALSIAITALRNYEISSAIVGAVDMSKDLVHQSAAHTVLGQSKTSDAAVLVVLKRYAEAQADQDLILAVVGEEQAPPHNTLKLSNRDSLLETHLGRAHACSGMLHIAAAIMATVHKFTPATATKSAQPNLLPHKALTATVHNSSFTKESATTIVSGAPAELPPTFTLQRKLKIFSYSGATRELLKAALQENRITTTRDKFNLAYVATVAKSEQLRTKALELLTQERLSEGWNGEILYRTTKVTGELAFVYTGAAASYLGMGRELLLEYPYLVESLHHKLREPNQMASWIYEDDQPKSRLPFYQLVGSAFLCQLHTAFSRNLLGLTPDAVLGLSSGETNAMLAFDIWGDMDHLFNDVAESGLYDEALGEKFTAVREFWGEQPDYQVKWANWRVLAPVTEVTAALKNEARVYLTIINTSTDCVIGGEEGACARVLKKLPTSKVMPLQHDIAIHAPVVKPFASIWKKLHTRPTKPLTGIRFYSNYFASTYKITQQNVATALTGQALQPIDFPKIVKQAWADGVRVFVEHGPRNSLSMAIREILQDKPHVAVALDLSSSSALKQALQTAAELWSVGVEVSLENFIPKALAKEGAKAATISFPLHLPPITFPQIIGKQIKEKAVEKYMTPAPELGVEELVGVQSVAQEKSVKQERNEEEELAVRAAPPAGANSTSAIADEYKLFATIHTEMLNGFQGFLALQTKAYNICAAYLGGGERSNRSIAPVTKSVTDATSTPINSKGQPATKIIEKTAAVQKQQEQSPNLAPPVRETTIRETKEKSYPGPAFTREQLEILAAGKISTVFGTLFAPQDQYEVQVRMPEPPLLLCDRVLGIAGEPGSLGVGTIWTETDVGEDSWYLHQGRMPAGIFIEAGQADLLLISWLGIDFYNKGERAYRLLGCDLTFHDHLPKPGDLLKYEIHVDGYATQGEVRLFFFHYDCHVNDKLALTVRNAQAGFFSKKELWESGGVLWQPETANYSKGITITLPPLHTQKTKFTQEEVTAYTNGEMVNCFGPELAWTETHTRTPRTQAGEQNFIQEVTEFNLHGGPEKRGYLKAESTISPDDWYFKGHFKNDPCMPGTLMVEGCVQMMAFYMVGLGLTLYKDGWRFEPVTEAKYKFVCRGQVIPSSKKLSYEVFVDEIVLAPYPTLFAHVLCTVDGTKAFLCERLGLKLVPDWPLTSMPQLLTTIKAQSTTPAAEVDGFKYDYISLINAALGDPSRAFGVNFKSPDDINRSPRLPGPPYHFMSRITKLAASYGQMTGNPAITVEYDIPQDAWYFRENGAVTMPYCVLMEIGLQPCGWLATFIAKNKLQQKELLFRNLDGTAIQHREITPNDRVIETTTVLTSVTKLANIIIVGFKVECKCQQEQVFTMQTVFGFFDLEAMKAQKGLKITAREQQNVTMASNYRTELKEYPAPYFNATTARLPASKLLMIDRVTAYEPQGGKEGLGYVRAEKDVVASDWFFKAHFFQDPVQPGSLGIEGIIQVIQYYMLQEKYHLEMTQPHFEPIIIGGETEWHYRGQVVPDNSLITIDIDVIAKGEDAKGRYVLAEARLWVDGLKIYHAPKIGVRLVAAAG